MDKRAMENAAKHLKCDVKTFNACNFNVIANHLHKEAGFKMFCVAVTQGDFVRIVTFRDATNSENSWIYVITHPSSSLSSSGRWNSKYGKGIVPDVFAAWDLVKKDCKE